VELSSQGSPKPQQASENSTKTRYQTKKILSLWVCLLTIIDTLVLTKKENMQYPKIRLPMPIICWLPCRIARRAPHLDSGWVTAVRAPPHRINRSRGEGVVRMIRGEGHDRSMWIITPLH
jgi:hypothetical protein